MEALVNSALPENILLDGPVDHESIESGAVGRGHGLPFWWGYDLNK